MIRLLSLVVALLVSVPAVLAKRPNPGYGPLYISTQAYADHEYAAMDEMYKPLFKKVRRRQVMSDKWWEKRMAIYPKIFDRHIKLRNAYTRLLQGQGE